jgi:hypothetical protein
MSLCHRTLNFQPTTTLGQHTTLLKPQSYATEDGQMIPQNMLS